MPSYLDDSIFFDGSGLLTFGISASVYNKADAFLLNQLQFQVHVNPEIPDIIRINPPIQSAAFTDIYTLKTDDVKVLITNQAHRFNSIRVSSSDAETNTCPLVIKTFNDSDFCIYSDKNSDLSELESAIMIRYYSAHIKNVTITAGLYTKIKQFIPQQSFIFIPSSFQHNDNSSLSTQKEKLRIPFSFLTEPLPLFNLWE
jgi:hypothetical protein